MPRLIRSLPASIPQGCTLHGLSNSWNNAPNRYYFLKIPTSVPPVWFYTF